MSNCVFCQIVKGEAPVNKIYEDERFLAFLEMYPLCEGHTLVIPKKHYCWVWDVPQIGEYLKVCQKIACHFQKVTGKEKVQIYTIGEAVPHAHIHLLPPTSGQEKFAVVAHLAHESFLSFEDGQKVAAKFRL
ncbi:HIT family protein [candidate division WWE3 bacterium CG_4_8_14_3_um_filter_42_11]|uniref:HIT family protein n=2 Tax=Katanobacteria TaxID=422282 RepID=A0A2M7WX51_UNCKA|nr:MAG: HIT family protein [candidate division WWE3 bacterium CG_4_9_14_3_um_filter_43_9]PJC69202.1 MAG: HIT family protein [candidate division WWE3 bacterium CG_4_8_14_3_um_filter_42_11]